VQALVLCPTRELADQVGKELRRLAQAIPNIKLVSLCGGKPFGPQKGSLEHGAHIVVGTPGRVLDHLLRNTLELGGLKTLVLDEADRMLDMGFSEQMSEIVSRAPKTRQTLLFSATFPDEIRKISRSIQRNPLEVTVEEEHAPGVIRQMFYEVKKHERNNTLLALFEHYQPETSLVFCHTRKQCAEVAELLDQNRIQCLAIHGDLEQRERDQVLVQFANNSCPVLVATDVAARGLDIKSLQAVINYELPRQPETYVHRIGRTGRAGEKGIALSIFTEAEQVRVNAIERLLSTPSICDVYASLDRHPGYSLRAPMVTIQVDAGRKQKIRPGDLLGALTGDAGLQGSQIGKIDIFDMCSFVAVEHAALRQAMNYLANGKVKGRNVRARRVTG
jgi:ATP-independent RNA helicase DbpA